MSLAYPGGFITKNPTAPTANAAPGIWTMDQALQYIKAGTWPTPPQPDQYFNYTTLLLPGSGTNGAQNNTFLDSSTNAFTITRNGNTTQGTFSPFSQTGWSNYFDGSGDYLTVPYNANLALGTSDFTIEAWLYPITLAAAQDPFGMHADSPVSSADIAWFMYVGANNSGNAITVCNGTTDYAITGWSLTANVWQHVALTRASGSLKFFINGTQVGSTVSANVSLNNNTAWKTWVGTYTAASRAFNGYISNFRIVKGTAVYTAAFTPPTAALTAITNTSLLTCQSNRFIDNSSNAFAITVNGNTSVQAFSPFNPTAAYSAATNGGSGYFDGTGDYLATSTTLSIGTGDFTVEAWTYITATGTSIFGVGDMDLSSGFAVYRNSSDYWLLFAAGTTRISSSGTSTVIENQWNHVALVRSSGVTKLYINGVALPTTYSDSNNYSGTIYVGANNYGGSVVTDMTGYISGVQFASGALYTTTFTPPTAPPTTTVSAGSCTFLANFTNAGIYDATAKNDLETVGGAQISTTQSKFGGSSMYFDGTGDYLTVRSGPWLQFGKDFTLECWIYPTSSASNQMIFSSVDYWRNSLGLQLLTNRTIKFNMCDVESSSGVYDEVTTSSTVSLNAWSHIAVVRYNGTLSVYINGTSGGSTSSTRINYIPTGLTAIASDGGSYLNSSLYTGFIDDLRVTNGVARYTANFTPPTTAFFLF